MSKIERLFRAPGLSSGNVISKVKTLKQVLPLVAGLRTELCFNIEITSPLSDADRETLQWILGNPLYPEELSTKPHLKDDGREGLLIEIGPRLNFSTAFSSNAVSICQNAGLTQITRLEVSIRYLVQLEQKGLAINPDLENKLVGVLHDKMTQCRYLKPLETFDLGIVPEPWFEVDIVNRGRQALEEVNSKLGLAFDSWDLDYYTDLFKSKLKRNPTSVECFDLAQSNSEHSRHWFFKGRMVIDGNEHPESLIDMVMSTQQTSNQNNVIKFNDNSSAIKGFDVQQFLPENPGKPSPLKTEPAPMHLIFTAETHNFPTGVAPFSGATTGTGGRLRDVHAVGRGGHCIAGTAGYSVGNLHIPSYDLPWEERSFEYPGNFALPLEVLIEASNGASDYGNKFGEPLISGFVRSFGIVDSSGERREWIKPIMFSGGVGAMNADMVDKEKPQRGMSVVKIGGPVYRIGVGGGSASSVEVQGDNTAELDFGAVQRGDAEMEQKMNRVIRACLEMGKANPILSIHDQGAGGNGNVLKELVEPEGAVIFTKNFQLGDPTISTLELWGAEYQENDALLCKAEDMKLLAGICQRERCPVNFVGTVTGTGKVVLSEEENPDATKYLDGTTPQGPKRHPVDLDLELVLGKMPRKVFHLDSKPTIVKTLSLPASLTVGAALERVLRLPSVSSKRYLTNKVDRCVTGLIAQQQCVGPLHTPLADVAVTAISMFNTEGIASAIGEQPIKGLVDPRAGARMTVAEAISNLVFAKITDLKDVKCSGNWMWAAKLPGEGAALFDACQAMCQTMAQLGIAIDGGKDSLSMAARVGRDTVKAPGTLVVSAYAPCPDVRVLVTPDLKGPATSPGGKGALILVDVSTGKVRLGGTALAQCFRQLGDAPPDLDDAALLARAFAATQSLIGAGDVLAGHDVSDGGLVTCLLEMAFAGISGLDVSLNYSDEDVRPLELLFAEEVGWVLEVRPERVEAVLGAFAAAKVPAHHVGWSTGLGVSSRVSVKVREQRAIDSELLPLMRLWEETSFRLECRQTNTTCARREFDGLGHRRAPKYHLTFDPNLIPEPAKKFTAAPRVAVIREEGSNGDREMAASLHMAGFQVWDVTMQDLLDGTVTVDRFRGAIFPGGFSFADVLGSAKGWAASFLRHPQLRLQMDAFAKRSDTFSLGVCNGCQLLSLLGWVGGSESPEKLDVVLDHNNSERFECRFSTVRIEESKSMMLKGMAGSVFGVWVAHGEGRFTTRTDAVLEKLESGRCVALRYTDEDGKPTQEYPLNPNGSVAALAGICSEDGRHLAMMPHPERCTKMWQWPWAPPAWSESVQVSPWHRMFRNAFTWCVDSA